MRAVDLVTGNPIWRLLPPTFGERIYSLAMDRGTVFVAHHNPSKISAYALPEGRRLWESEFLKASADEMLIKGPDLYVLNGAALDILDAKTGNIKQTRPRIFPNSVYVFGDRAYMSNGEGLTALNFEGNLLWRYPKQSVFLHQDNGVLFGSPVRQDTLIALTANSGTPLWSQSLPARPVSPAVPRNGIAYVMLDNASVMGFDVATGVPRGTLQTNLPLGSPYAYDKGLAADDTNLYMSFGDNVLFAYGE